MRRVDVAMRTVRSSPWASSLGPSFFSADALEFRNRLTRDDPATWPSARDAGDVAGPQVPAHLLEAQPELVGGFRDSHGQVAERARVHYLDLRGLDPMLSKPGGSLKRPSPALCTPPQLGDLDRKLPHLSFESWHRSGSPAQICELQIQSFELARQRRETALLGYPASHVRAGCQPRASPGSGPFHGQDHHSSDYSLVATLRTMLQSSCQDGSIATC